VRRNHSTPKKKKKKRVSNGKLTIDTLMMNPKTMVKRKKVERAAFVSSFGP